MDPLVAGCSVQQAVIRFTLSFYVFSIHVASTFDLTVSRIGPKWSTYNSNGVIQPTTERPQESQSNPYS